MSKLASRCSMYIDRRLLYFVMQGYVLFGGEIPNSLPDLPTRYNDFTADMYYQYMTTMFKISDVVRGPDRVFCSDGVGLETDGVSCGVHYMKRIGADDDDAALLNAIQFLSLPDDDDDDDDDDSDYDDDDEGSDVDMDHSKLLWYDYLYIVCFVDDSHSIHPFIFHRH
jgi:hypothetical protein